MYKYKSRSYSKLVAIKLGMWAEADAQNDCHPQGNHAPPQVSVSDPQCGMMSRCIME